MNLAVRLRVVFFGPEVMLLCGGVVSDGLAGGFGPGGAVQGGSAVPASPKRCTRLLPASTTQMAPRQSAVSRNGWFSSPGAVPTCPKRQEVVQSSKPPPPFTSLPKAWVKESAGRASSSIRSPSPSLT